MQYGYGYFEEDKLGEVADFRLWRRIIGYMSRYWHGVGLAVFLSFIVIGTSLLLPYMIRIGVDQYIINTDIAVAARLAGLAKLAGLFVIAVIGGFLANFSQVAVLEWTGQNVMHRLRQHLFRHMLGLDMAFFHSNPSGKLVTRLTNDIQNMHEMFTSVIVTLFNDAMRILGILALLYWLNWRLAVIISLLLPLIILLTIWFSRVALDAFPAWGERIVARQRLLEATATRVVAECTWDFLPFEGDATADMPRQSWTYTLYPSGDLYIHIDCTTETATWTADRVGLAVSRRDRENMDLVCHSTSQLGDTGRLLHVPYAWLRDGDSGEPGLLFAVHDGRSAPLMACLRSPTLSRPSGGTESRSSHAPTAVASSGS